MNYFIISSAFAHPGHGVEGNWHFISHGVESILNADLFGFGLAFVSFGLLNFCLIYGTSAAIRALKRVSGIKRR